MQCNVCSAVCVQPKNADPTPTQQRTLSRTFGRAGNAVGLRRRPAHTPDLIQDRPAPPLHLHRARVCQQLHGRSGRCRVASRRACQRRFSNALSAASGWSSRKRRQPKCLPLPSVAALAAGTAAGCNSDSADACDDTHVACRRIASRPSRVACRMLHVASRLLCSGAVVGRGSADGSCVRNARGCLTRACVSMHAHMASS
jgi:hypothetical protein